MRITTQAHHVLAALAKLQRQHAWLFEPHEGQVNPFPTSDRSEQAELYRGAHAAWRMAAAELARMTEPVAMGQSVVSYSVFVHRTGGSWRSEKMDNVGTMYMRFLPTLVRAHHAVWPGWEMRIHHDDHVKNHPYFPSLSRMHERGLIRLVDCGKATQLCIAMLWRLLPAFENDDRIVVCYDVDALPLLKMRLCVEDFMRSDKAVMLVHDCESHDGMMGGTTTVKSARFRSLVKASSLQNFTSLAGRIGWDAYASDEDYMRRTIWPMVSKEGLIFHFSGKPTTLACDDVRSELSGGVPEGLLPEVVDLGNAFAPYIGSAGYDMARAITFYDNLDLEAIRAIRDAETVDPALVTFPERVEEMARERQRAEEAARAEAAEVDQDHE